LVMAAVELAGNILGFQVGFAMANVLDPVSQVQTPVFGQLMTVLATLLYFQVDGHLLVLLALGSSFQLIPPFGAHLSAPLLSDVTGLIQTTYQTGANVRTVSMKRMRRPNVHGSVASNPETCKLIIGSFVA